MSNIFKILPKPVDGILWKADLLYDKNSYIGHRKKALEQIANTIALVKDSFVRTNYVEVVAKQLGLKPKDVKDYITKTVAIAEAHEEEEDEKRDVISNIVSTYHLDKQQEFTLRNFLYWAVTDKSKPARVGYYFATGNNWAIKQLSNFYIVPLYHVKVRKNERRILAIENGYESKLIEVDSATISSADAFRKEVNRFGPFWWKGSTENLISVMQSFPHDAFPPAYELASLGWHPTGFWAFCNVAYNGTVEPYNEHGMYQHGTVHYNVPFLSPIDSDYEQDDASFEFELYLKYVKAPITFTQWADLMCKSYLEKGPVGICFAVATLFRDIVLQSTKLPMLYNYGAVQAGKSDYSDSITNLFFAGKDHQNEMYKPFNLNQGTDFAFFTRMERFRNCPNTLNEFDENKIPENWFRAIKGAFDGEGREKGDMDRKGKTKAQRINCSIVLNGQFLGTKDDNSVVSRCLLNHFAAVINARPAEQVKAFTQLKKYEKKGLSSIICDLLEHRQFVKENYAKTFDLAQEFIFTKLTERNVKPQVRMVKNWASILTIHNILAQLYTLPYSMPGFEEYVLQKVAESTAIIGSTNTLAGFWGIFQYLVDTKEITQGFHWALVSEHEIEINEQDQPLKFSTPKQVLYIRTGAIFPFYQQAASRQKTDTLSKPNLDSYMRETEYFLGTRQRRFSGIDAKNNKLETNPTSCVCLDFDHKAIQALSLALNRTGTSQQDMGLESRPNPF